MGSILHKLRLIKVLWQGPTNRTTSVRDTIEELIDDEAPQSINNDALDQTERTLLSNILRLRDVPADEIMMPRADIVGVAAESTLEEALETLSSTGHLYLPVYRETLDHVQGILSSKSINNHISKGGKKSVIVGKTKDLLERPLFVAPSARPLDLWIQMRSHKANIALVVDEFGGVDGLITTEDIIEAMLEDIEVFDPKTQESFFVPQGDGTMIASGRAEIHDIEDYFGCVLTDDDRLEDVDTIGGFVSYLAGTMPKTGDVYTHETGLEFEILDADPRRVKRVHVKRKSVSESSDLL